MNKLLQYWAGQWSAGRILGSSNLKILCQKYGFGPCIIVLRYYVSFDRSENDGNKTRKTFFNLKHSRKRCGKDLGSKV